VLGAWAPLTVFVVAGLAARRAGVTGAGRGGRFNNVASGVHLLSSMSATTRKMNLLS